MEELLSVVDALEGETVQLLQQLIRVPSENPPGDYVPVSAVLQDWCERLGFEVTVIDAPESETERLQLVHPRRNLLITSRGSGGGRNIVLNAHLDTVPAGYERSWTYSPFSGTIQDGRVYGRGATDSKGRLAAYIMTAVALQRAGVPQKGDLIIAATCDEETGGRLGAGYVVEHGFIQADVAIVEGYSNQIIRAMAGVLYGRVIVRGVSAHAGWKWKGINAIEKMARIMTELEVLQEEFMKEPSQVPGMRYTAINMGLIRGGTKTNVVPDFCEVDFECRVIPEHSLDEVRMRMTAVIQGLRADEQGFSVEFIWRPEDDIEPTIVHADEPIIRELQQAVTDITGETLPVVGVLGQSDARWFIQHGISAINYGPGTPENYLHHPDENIKIRDLMQTIKVLAVFASRVVG